MAGCTLTLHKDEVLYGIFETSIRHYEHHSIVIESTIQYIQYTGWNMKRTKQQKQKNGKNVVSRLASEYTANTTIHGLGYLGAKDKSIFEKAWWLVGFVMSLIACAYLIYLTWIKWIENPGVIRFSSKQVPIHTIPFPAVAICPINRIVLSKYNYTRALLNYKNLTKDERKKFLAVSLICDLKDVNVSKEYTVREDVYDHILQASASYTDVIQLIIWKTTRALMPFAFLESRKFKPILTEEGLCLSFNSLSRQDMYTERVREHAELGHTTSKTGWNIAEGYPEHIKDNRYYPEVAKREGTGSGLRVILRSRAADREYKCGPRMSGYKIYIHNPAERPRINEQHILLPFNKFMSVSVEPNVITASSSLKHVSPHTRNCYFPYEKQLKYYAMYTQNNCRSECFANLTKAKCKCLPFYLPRELGDLICGHHNDDCLNDTRITMFKYELKVWLFDRSENWNKWYGMLDECDCKSSCATLEYDTESSQTDFYFTNISIPDNYFGMFSSGGSIIKKGDTDYTQLEIFFRNKFFLGKQRGALFEPTDLITNCGGLLGLCLGVSFLSVMEIVYFLTLRLYYMRKEKQRVHFAVYTRVVELAEMNAVNCRWSSSNTLGTCCFVPGCPDYPPTQHRAHSNGLTVPAENRAWWTAALNVPDLVAVFFALLDDYIRATVLQHRCTASKPQTI